VTGTADTADRAYDLIVSTRPDVAVVDLHGLVQANCVEVRVLFGASKRSPIRRGFFAFLESWR
jgi:phage-related protein